MCDQFSPKVHKQTTFVFQKSTRQFSDFSTGLWNVPICFYISILNLYSAFSFQTPLFVSLRHLISLRTNAMSAYCPLSSVVSVLSKIILRCNKPKLTPRRFFWPCSMIEERNQEENQGDLNSAPSS